MEEPQFDSDMLMKIADAVMPFGKYAGRRLVDLPEAYVLWFRQKGFPPGELGTLLASVCEIKANGLEYLFGPLRRGTPATSRSDSTRTDA